MQRKVITVISQSTLTSLSEHIPRYELVAYDTNKYRNNTFIDSWVGRKIVGLPLYTLALVAIEGIDDIGKYITLSMAVLLEEQISKVA